MDLKAQVKAFKDDLPQGGGGPADWPLAVAFNTLLEQAKASASDDAIIGAIEPIKQGPGHKARVDTATLRVLAGQLYSAL